MKKSFLAWIFALAMLLPACQTPADPSVSAPDSQSSSSGGGQGVDEKHTDDDDDGTCDTCQENVLVTLDFYAVNDLHGKFEDSQSQIGVDELSTYLETAKENNPYTFVLSSGDMWQGSPESNITKGVLITDWMNEMNFVSMSLGNHEFDWGMEYIKNNAEAAEFPFLGINVFDKKTNKRVDYCQPSVVVEKGDLKVGVIGAIGDCLSSISGDFNKNLDFKTGNTLSSLVKAESTRLRKEEGVDFIVYSIHADYDEYDIGLSNGYVDLVFEGHSHQTYVKKDSHGVYHLQGGGDNGNGISHAEITLNIANENYSAQAEHLSASVYANLADHTVVDDLMKKYEEQIGFAYQSLGGNAKLRNSQEILSLCAQLYYEKGVEIWGDQYKNIFLGGGFMSARAPYELSSGVLHYGDLMNVLPFDNQLVLCSIKGRDLKANFLSNKKNYYVYCGTYGQSNINSIVDNQTYYLVTDTYSSTYSYNNLTEIERCQEKTAIGEYIFARDLLAEYIKAGKWMSVSTIPQIIADGNALSANQVTNNCYAVWGRITEISSPDKYGNMTIQDENGNSLYIYGTYDTNGNKYGYMTTKPQVGDRVLLLGALKKYVNGTTTTIELINANILKTEQ